jgi:hypothetical protein
MKNIERYKNILATSIYNRSREWGDGYFLRRPADLPPNMDSMWNLLTGQAKFLAGMSDAEKGEFYTALSEAFSIDVKLKSALELKPRIMMRSVSNPEPMLQITVREFLRYTGGRSNTVWSREHLNEATYEDVQWYLNNFPQDKLDVLALNLELLPKHKEELRTLVTPMIKEATAKFFENATPPWEGWKILRDTDLTTSNRDNMAKLFSMLNPVADLSQWERIKTGDGAMSYPEHCALKVVEKYEDIKKNAVLIHTGRPSSSAFFGADGWQITSVPSEVEMYAEPTDAELKKALGAIPIEYKIMMLPSDTWEEWLEDEAYDAVTPRE